MKPAKPEAAKAASVTDEIMAIARESKKVRTVRPARELYEAHRAEIEAARTAGATWDAVSLWFKKRGIDVSTGALRNMAWKLDQAEKGRTAGDGL